MECMNNWNKIAGASEFVDANTMEHSSSPKMLDSRPLLIEIQ